MTLRSRIASLPTAIYARARAAGVIDHPLGERLFVETYWLYKRFWEDPFHALLARRPRLLGDGDVLDVGANLGYTAALFAGALAPGRRVYAFEPEADNFRRLEENVARRRVRTLVEPVRAAVGASEGTVPLWKNRDHHADHRVVTDALRGAGRTPDEEVPLVSLDGFVAARRLERVSFVKIDVQGYELPVLRGMARLLAGRSAPAVAVELCPPALAEMGFAAAELLDALAGQRLHLMGRGGRLTPIDAAGALAAAGARGYVDLLATREPLA